MDPRVWQQAEIQTMARVDQREEHTMRTVGSIDQVDTEEMESYYQMYGGNIKQYSSTILETLSAIFYEVMGDASTANTVPCF
ncbi:hypothetical protein PROFUN_04374 [Planoprotostelium fungivorum]|uniref:Uncharacterized protein n=1 Tax=Planoprotostelium fungivorum TaxID=1890364 RepID=A0A2P6NHR8_9EUKA|nr:hypothetical protein PROFUN_04374 [Planoprotostelium fungivorum]